MSRESALISTCSFLRKRLFYYKGDILFLLAQTGWWLCCVGKGSRQQQKDGKEGRRSNAARLIFRKFPQWMHQIQWPASEKNRSGYVAERNLRGKSYFALWGYVCLFFWGLLPGSFPASAGEPVRIYAAASLSGAMEDIARIAEHRGVILRLIFGGSSTLARQIAQGAPADVFFSANPAWMDDLSQRGLLEPDTRADLLGNALVLIAPKGEGFAVDPRPDFNIAGAFRGRLAIGDPAHVPAGIYAKEALEKLGWWDALKDRLAPAMDVRGAFSLVARGECPVGIVYATDAAISTGVETIAVLPDSLHAPIIYPVAVVKGRRTPDVEAAMRLLQSDEATGIFRQYGFRVLERQ